MTAENPNVNCTNGIQAYQCERLCNFEIALADYHMWYSAAALDAIFVSLRAARSKSQSA